MSRLNLRRSLSLLGVALRDFLFPPVCLGCRQRETTTGLVCGSCLEELASHTTTQPRYDEVPGLSHIRSLGAYAPPFSTLVQEFKYRNRYALAPVLANPLAGLLLSDAMLKQADVLVPVPLHPARLRERGYNQSELLARAVAILAQRPWQNALRRIRNTKAQVQLDDLTRQKNMEGAFAARADANLKGKWVLLIDDVSTTGATLASAASELRQAGAVGVSGLVIARRRANS